jgi:hypothetical protein
MNGTKSEHRAVRTGDFPLRKRIDRHSATVSDEFGALADKRIVKRSYDRFAWRTLGFFSPLSWFALAILFFIAFPLDARDYYVSSRGRDSQPGSSALPWRTIEQVNRSRFRPGDRILFRGRDTFDGQLVLEGDRGGPANPMVIGSYGAARAIIRAGTGTAVSVRNQGGIVIRDLIVTGNGIENLGIGVEILNDAQDDSKLDSVTIENVEASGFRWAGIYVGGPVFPFQRASGSSGQAGFRNVRLIQCVAHHNVHCGVRIAGRFEKQAQAYANENVAVLNCVAHHNAGDPAYRDNHSGNGILLENTRQGRIERSAAYSNGALNGSRLGGPVGIWAHNATEVTIERCISYRNRSGRSVDGGGFDFDGGVSDSVMQYNYSYENDGPGYMIWNYNGSPRSLHHNVIRYNVSVGDALRHSYGSIHVGTTGEPISDLDVYGNTVIANGPNPGAVPLWAGGGHDARVRFHGNLLIASDQAKLVWVDCAQNDTAFADNSCKRTGEAAPRGSGKVDGPNCVGRRNLVGFTARPSDQPGRASMPPPPQLTDPLRLFEIADYFTRAGDWGVDSARGAGMR